jgi:hypothetical protein
VGSSPRPCGSPGLTGPCCAAKERPGPRARRSPSSSAPRGHYDALQSAVAHATALSSRAE